MARIKERSAKIEAMLACTAEASVASPYVPVQADGYKITQKNIPPDTTQREKSANFAKLEEGEKFPTFGGTEGRYYTRVIVYKRYELSNHLGNVLATITDRKVIRGRSKYDGGPKKSEKATEEEEKTLNSQFLILNLDLALEGAFFEPDVATADDYYPFGMAMPGRTWKAREADGYRYGFNGMEEEPNLGEELNRYTTLNRIYDPQIGRWFSTDPMADKFPDWSPYNNNENNPIINTDPNGDCPWCLTAAVGAAVGGIVEFGGQLASNMLQKDRSQWLDIDYADVAIAAGEGAIVGLTGGLGAAGKLSKVAVKATNTTIKLVAATAQGAVDAKQKEFGGVKVLGAGKSASEVVIDATVNMAGAGLGGKAPTGSKKVTGLVPNAKTGKQAVAQAKKAGHVTQAQKTEIKAKADAVYKSRNIANETIKGSGAGTASAAAENVVGDWTKGIYKKLTGE